MASNEPLPEFTVEYRTLNMDAMVWQGPFTAYFVVSDGERSGEALSERAVEAAKDDAVAHREIPLSDVDDLVDVRASTVRPVE